LKLLWSLELGIWSFSYLPSVIELGNPFSQLLGEFHGLADIFSDSVLAQPAKPTIANSNSSSGKRSPAFQLLTSDL